METLTPLDVFLFWSKRIPEHAVKPPSLATDLVLLNFLSCVQISCQWGCGTYFDSFVAKFVATCVWNGYQISEINLFVSSPLMMSAGCHWFAWSCSHQGGGGQALFDGQQDVWGISAMPILWAWHPEPGAKCGRSIPECPWEARISAARGWNPHECWPWARCGCPQTVFVPSADFLLEFGALQTWDQSLTRQEACVSFLFWPVLLVLLGTTVLWRVLPESSRRVSLIATSTSPGNLLDIFSPPTSSQIYWIRDCRGVAQPPVLLVKQTRWFWHTARLEITPLDHRPHCLVKGHELLLFFFLN